MKITDRLANQHPSLAEHQGKILKGCCVTVEGVYLSRAISPDHTEKQRIPYSENFEIPTTPEDGESVLPSEQVALGFILRRHLLSTRLLAKDKNFRSVLTHTVTLHEHVVAEAPPEAPPEE